MFTRKTNSIIGAAVIAGAFAIAPSAVSAYGCATQTSSETKTVAYGGKTAPTKNIVQTAVEAGQFNTLAALLTQAELVEALQGDGPFTVFAPTDEAFAAVPKPVLNRLGSDTELLKQILLYHVASGSVKAGQVVGLDEVTTLQGSAASVKAYDGKVKVGGANVVATDIETSNGVIHVIDAVILPPAVAEAVTERMSKPNIVETAVAAGSFKTLAALVTQAGLADTLSNDGPFTVFAPTDAAFAKLPKETLQAVQDDPELLKSVLLNHVVPGDLEAKHVLETKEFKTAQGAKATASVKDGKAMIQDAGIAKTDIIASNGVIHVIDSVIIPPAKTEEKAARAGRY